MRKRITVYKSGVVQCTGLMQPSGHVLVVVVALVRVGERVVGDESVPGRLGVCVVRSVVISVVVGEVAVVVSTTVVTTAGVVPVPVMLSSEMWTCYVVTDLG